MLGVQLLAFDLLASSLLVMTLLPSINYLLRPLHLFPFATVDLLQPLQVFHLATVDLLPPLHLFPFDIVGYKLFATQNVLNHYVSESNRHPLFPQPFSKRKPTT